jgi:hypothetical protein
MISMQYFVSVIDDGQARDAGRTESATDAEMAAIDVFNDKLQSNGNWVFAAGLGTPETATVIDNRGETPVITDGPYVETKEYAAGFWIMEAADLDAVLKLVEEGSKACNRRLEVRPLLGPPE